MINYTKFNQPVDFAPEASLLGDLRNFENFFGRLNSFIRLDVVVMLSSFIKLDVFDGVNRFIRLDDFGNFNFIRLDILVELNRFIRLHGLASMSS